MSLSDRLFCNHHAHPLRQAWSYRLRCAKEVFVWFKSRLNPWYISIPSNPNLYSITIIMKMRWQTIASSVSMRTISPTATPLPTAYDCVAVYIAGRRINLVVYGCRPQPTTKNVPGIPGACATRNFRYLVRGPWHIWCAKCTVKFG